MSPLLLVPAAVLSLVYRASAADQGPISIFIDMVPEYRALETCAETELSTIVRNMAFGCGDDSRTTSYGCFCYESSAKFSSIIGKHVGTACADHYPQQNTSAIEVFSKYCDLGELTPANASSMAIPCP